MVRSVNGLIRHVDEPGGASAYFNITADTTYMMQDSLYAIQTLIGDAFVVRHPLYPYR